MAIFKGAGVALVTPMNQDGSVNYDQLEKLIEFQISNSTDAIIITGTTGESSTLTEAEHQEVIKSCISMVNKRVPVIAGTGSNSTDTAVMLTKAAQADGADGALVVTPYYNKATQKGLIAHYTAIASATDLPIVLYNVPSRTGVNIMPDTAVTLAKNCDNIVAIKEASGNLSQVASLMEKAEGCIDLYSGNDDQITPILSLGGYGVISVLSNIAPLETHNIVASYLNGDAATSTKLQLEAMPLIQALFSEVNPIPVKKAMNLMGLNAGPLRLPLTEMEDIHVPALVEAMKAYGLKLV